MELWGRAIAYGGSSEKNLNIRHFLSGGFLHSKKGEDTKKPEKIIISEPFEDYLEKQLYYKGTIEATAEAYLKEYSLTLAREASSDEDHTLDAFNLFQIRDPNFYGEKVLSLTLKTDNFTSDGNKGSS